MRFLFFIGIMRIFLNHKRHNRCTKGFCFLLCLLWFSNLIGQEEKPKPYQLSGYIKNLQSAYVIDNVNPFVASKKLVISDNLLHNRLNFKYFLNDNWTLKTDLRNRFFWGDQPQLPIGVYSEQLDLANDYFDLSYEWSDASGVAFQSMIDRAYLEYASDDWEVRLGRQRINWGISTLWNPNDIFNAYNFADFDYEERPGSDAIRVKYYPNFSSSIELAASMADSLEATTIAAKGGFNVKGYDVQLLAGFAENDWVFGGGWAGNIKGASLKGEFSTFTPVDTGKTSVAITFNIDYQFKNSLYANAGFLYNSLGRTSGDLSQLFNLEISAKNLYPFRYTVFTQFGYPLGPLSNLGGAIIYSPVESQAIFFTPTFTYSLRQNLDLDIVGQVLFNDDGMKYTSPVQAGFLRVKWSY